MMYSDLLMYAFLLWFLFLAVTFGFSAFEKLADYKGTQEYYTSYFDKVFISKMLSWVMPLIIFIEIVITIFYLLGIYQLLMHQLPYFSFIASLLGGFLLLLFLIGQRLVKDYEGAVRLAVYFIVCILPLFLYPTIFKEL